jgi:Lrp/AsnC family leucine-responsive transcriptional regulator
MSNKYTEYDAIDRKVVEIMNRDAQTTNFSLAKLVGLSTSAVNERLRKLKNAGIIKKIVAIADSEFMQMSLCAYIAVTIDKPEYNQGFLASIEYHPNVLECHHITGDHSYLLKVRVENTKALETFITDFLKTQKGVYKTFTQIVLSSAKEESVIVG